MENKFREINLEWTNFLEKFSADQINITFSEAETGLINYSIENVLDTNISLSNKYGFLTVNFKDDKLKKRFLELTEIIYTKKSFGHLKLAQTTYSNNEYPCRVYPANNLMVNFYDKDEELVHREKLSNRIIVFQNVLLVIIRLKIEKINPELF